MLRQTRDARPAFTLLELLVVVSILAILAALVLPRLDGLQSNANHAVAAAAVADATKHLELYKKSKYVYPDGWDSLLNSAGTALWTASTPTTKGLHQQLSGSSAKFYMNTLTDAEITALNTAGIYTLYNVDASLTDTSTVRPGDAFNTKTTLATGQKAAFVADVANGNKGAKIIDHIYRDNKILNADGTVITASGTLPPNKRLLALGIGPHNAMIGKWMVEAPEYANVDRSMTYNRLLAIFELDSTGSTTKVVLRAVVGTDGDLLDDLTASMNKAVN